MEALKARIAELIETGKAKGVLTYKEVVELMGDVVPRADVVGLIRITKIMLPLGIDRRAHE